MGAKCFMEGTVIWGKKFGQAGWGWSMPEDSSA